MALIYIFGATFYATRFPECKWPGRFDLVFQSHQIFHVMVVVAALGKTVLPKTYKIPLLKTFLKIIYKNFSPHVRHFKSPVL